MIKVWIVLMNSDVGNALWCGVNALLMSGCGIKDWIIFGDFKMDVVQVC